MAKAVVASSLLCIGKYSVGFGGFLEFLFGGGVIGVFVRMMEHRQSTIRALDFLIGRCAINAQDFVIISLAHSKTLKPFSLNEFMSSGFQSICSCQANGSSENVALGRPNSV